MKRREFITLLGGAAAWPLTARAQQAGKVWRIGILDTATRELNTDNLAAFYKGLRDFGYVEGQNLIIEYRSANDRIERLPDLVSELLRLKVDLIVLRGTPEVGGKECHQHDSGGYDRCCRPGQVRRRHLARAPRREYHGAELFCH
jgi:ABC-type uncharacterized transport system substrate-binding protein